MTTKNKKNFPAKCGSTALAVTNVNDAMVVDAVNNSGFEGMGPEDIAIPFIAILQSGSPQVRGKSKIKGCNEGDFFNTVTQENYGNEIKLISCIYQKAYVEWVTRDNGGGFVKQHLDSSILDKTNRDDRGRDMLKNGNQIVTTAYHYCVLVKKNTPERVVIGFTSTQLKKSRKWNSQMMSLQIKNGDKILTPPMYSHIYTAGTVEESNDLGTWTGWSISNPVPISDLDVYNYAKKFRSDVSKGTIKTAPPPSDIVNNNNDEDVL